MHDKGYLGTLYHFLVHTTTQSVSPYALGSGVLSSTLKGRQTLQHIRYGTATTTTKMLKARLYNYHYFNTLLPKRQMISN